MKLFSLLLLGLVMVVFSEKTEKWEKSYTLESYLNLILEQNQDIQIRGYGVKEAKANTKNKLKSSPLNTGITVDNSVSNRLSTDVLDSVNIVQNRSNNISANVSKKLITGSEVGVSYGYSFSDGNSKKLPADLRSYHNTFLNVSLSQPLIAGLSNIYKRRDWKMSKAEEKINNLQFKILVNQKVLDGVKKYYNLMLANHQMKLKFAAHKLSQKTLKTIELLVEKDLESRSKLHQIQSEVIRSENDIYQAKNDMHTKRLDFLDLINQPDMGQIINLPTDPLKPFSVENKFEVEEVWKNSLEMRGDYQIELAKEKKSNIQLAIKKSSTLPNLSLTSNYYVYGTDGEIGETFSKMSAQDFNSWSVGLNMNMVIDPYHRKNQLAPLKITLRESKHRKESLEKKIKQDIQSTLNILELRYKQYLSTEHSKKLSDENFTRSDELLKKKFISIEDYLKAQKDKQSTDINHFRSSISFSTDFYSFLEKQGSLLKEFGISVPD